MIITLSVVGFVILASIGVGGYTKYLELKIMKKVADGELPPVSLLVTQLGKRENRG